MQTALEDAAQEPGFLQAQLSLVRQGNRLTVVRNFSKMIATLRLTHDGRRAVLLDQEASSAERVLTTAKTLRGRILYVDSKFDEAVASPPYEVITDPTR